MDWKRRRCFVEPTDLPGRAKWGGQGDGLSFEITRGMRDVVLGEAASSVWLSRRAEEVLDQLRITYADQVVGGGTVIQRSSDQSLHWWTWAGAAANRTLHASLGGIVDPRQRINDRALRLKSGEDLRAVSAKLTEISSLARPEADAHAIRGLKFSTALPAELAAATAAERLSDFVGANKVLGEQRKLRVNTDD